MTTTTYNKDDKFTFYFNKSVFYFIVVTTCLVISPIKKAHRSEPADRPFFGLTAQYHCACIFPITV